jgi:hypothetical protein
MSRLSPAALLLAAGSALLTALCLTAFVPAAFAQAGSPGSPVVVPQAVGGPRVILAFLPDRDVGPDAPQPGDPNFDPPSVLSTLNSEPTLALGLSSATQGGYQQVQALLDITQGTRTSTAAYSPRRAPALTFYPFDHDTQALFQGFLDAKDRANSAPAQIIPGLLGQSIPGGTAYVGVSDRDNVEAIAAVNEAGRIDEVSLGHSRSVAQRALDLSLDRRFVVAGLPPAQTGAHQLDLLLKRRPQDTQVIVMQTPPAQNAPALLPTGVAGLGKVGALTSTTTHLPGIVAGIDVLPTVFDKLGIAIPSSVKGQPMRVEGSRDQGALEALSQRLRVVGPQRFPTLEAVLAAWLGLLLLLGLVADRRGYRAALRIGALGTLWILPMLLVTAKLAPSKGTEILIVVVGTMGLGALTDRFVRWPRAPIVPCLVTVLAYAIDLGFGSPLIIRSLLGSNPLFGSRFYGIGNELESLLPVITMIGVAAYLDWRPRGRSMIVWFAGSMLFLGAVIGSGRLGADVGGVITIGAGGAVAVLFSLPGGISKKAIGVAIVVPVLALVFLAVLDTLTGGNGHFTRTVLHANGESAIQDIVQRRFELAFNVLKRGGMPFATGIAILAAAYAIRFRARVFAPLEGRPAWTAALVGSLASSIAGALANDSGPELLVIGVTAVAFVTAYIRGDPRLAVPVAAGGGTPASAPDPDPAPPPGTPLASGESPL